MAIPAPAMRMPLPSRHWSGCRSRLVRRTRRSPVHRRQTRPPGRHRRRRSVARPRYGGAHAQRGGGFQRIDSDRDIELLGLHILRVRGILVGGRGQQGACVGLHVEALVALPGSAANAAQDISAGAAKVNALRRLGTRPMGVTPASAAMASHQAPAALMSTGAV